MGFLRWRFVRRPPENFGHDGNDERQFVNDELKLENDELKLENDGTQLVGGITPAAEG
jgi:hypothetical protein